jgi:multidrug efflux pump subunit AcrA (membrane-fusion protein)
MPLEFEAKLQQNLHQISLHFLDPSARRWEGEIGGLHYNARNVMRSRPFLSTNAVVTRRENVQSDLEQAETAAKIEKERRHARNTQTQIHRERERKRITAQED